MEVKCHKLTDRWSNNGEAIAIVRSFNDLGIVLTSGGGFIQATKTLACKGIRAMDSLLSSHHRA